MEQIDWNGTRFLDPLGAIQSMLDMQIPMKIPMRIPRNIVRSTEKTPLCRIKKIGRSGPSRRAVPAPARRNAPVDFFTGSHDTDVYISMGKYQRFQRL